MHLMPAGKSNARTQAALGRLRKAMADIEVEILANKGIYPFNYGRVTQSELCRRADVKKATLQNTVHKDTTRIEIIRWLDALNLTLTQTRTGTRERVTALAQDLSAQVDSLSQACQVAKERLAQAEQRVAQLRQENALLRNRLGLGGHRCPGERAEF